MSRRAGEERICYNLRRFHSITFTYGPTSHVHRFYRRASKDLATTSLSAKHFSISISFYSEHYGVYSIDLFPPMYRRAGVSRHYVFTDYIYADTFDSRFTRFPLLRDVRPERATFAYSPTFANVDLHHPSTPTIHLSSLNDSD
jgi:hypothetical protein